MGTQETVEVSIGLHEVSTLRWPKETLTGDGPRVQADVPLPRLPWSKAAVSVPMGAGAARKVETVVRLRKIFGYGVAPVIILLFVVADVLLLGGRAAGVNPPGWLFATLGLAGVLLILTGLLPDLVSRRIGAPYVARGRLRFPAAKPAVVKQLLKLNPQATIESPVAGDSPSRR